MIVRRNVVRAFFCEWRGAQRCDFRTLQFEQLKCLVNQKLSRAVRSIVLAQDVLQRPTDRLLLSRAANSFFKSARRNGSSASSQPKVVADLRVLSQRRHSSAVSCFNSSFSEPSNSTVTPARPA